jgi:hypothetical protein
MRVFKTAETSIETRGRGSRRVLSTFLATLVTCAALFEGNALAQGTSPDVQTQTPQASTAPPTTLLRPYDQYDLDEAARKSRSVRNALIGTSSAFALGAILAGIGASQCTYFTNPNGSTDVDCNKAGDVLLPLGGTIAALSAIGMITTGIMLGVRNKHKRDIEREVRRRYSQRRLHFDEKSGGLVF